MSAVAAFHQDFRKIRNYASEFTDLIILILIYFEKALGFMPYSEDPHHWNGFSGEKDFIWTICSFLLLIINNSRSLPRLITDYEMQNIFLSVTCN